MEKAASNASSKAKKWTIMVYMAGDNNLDSAALRDIAEMAKVGSTKDVNVLVQLDRIEDKLTRRFRITKGGGLKLFAASCGESLILKEREQLSIRSLTPRQAAGNAFATELKQTTCGTSTGTPLSLFPLTMLTRN